MKYDATVLVDGADPETVAKRLAAGTGAAMEPYRPDLGVHPYGYHVSTLKWHAAIEPDASDWEIDGFATTVVLVNSNVSGIGVDIFELLDAEGMKVALLDETTGLAAITSHGLSA